MDAPQPNVLDAALDYARNRIPVFPTSPLDKKPLTANGFKNATTDEQQIRTWWQQWPSAMIAVPTGSASGMWVIDVDRDPARNIDGAATLSKLVAKHGALPSTLTSITPRDGRHLIFAWNGVEIRNSTGKLGRGIDVRGEGGYVCLPPSRRADGVCYRWDPDGADRAAEAPAWLIDLACENTKSKRDKAWARTALERECAAVAAAQPGNRNSALNTAAFSLFQIVAGGGLDEQEVRDRLFEAAEACGLVRDDGAQSVWATIDSAAQAARGQPRSRPSAQQHAQASGRPTIRLIGGELPQIVDAVEAALLTAGGFDLYQRGGLIVRPVLSKLKAADDRQTFGWQLVSVGQPYMVETLTRAAAFEKWDARAKAFVPKNCPDQVAETYRARVGHWRLPILLGIVNTPFLRVDGSICDQPGYDQASGLLFQPDGQDFPTVALNPSRGDAAEALAHLETLIAAFPFVGAVDRSVALSGILTAFDRRSMVTAPLHAFTSPVAGTGKSLLVDIASMLVSGQLAPVISQGRSEEELEKRLGTALMNGDLIISIDNCEHPLESVFLCQALTQQRLKIRILGHSRQVETPVNAAMFATGNNLIIANDLTRRTLLSSLDAHCERPELRTFDTNVIEAVRADRGRLVAAALTVMRAWHVARTAISVPSFGSFEQWSRRIREPLLWLDRADPCDSVVVVRDSDPGRSAHNAVLLQWKRVLGVGHKYTVQQVIGRAVVDADFQAALTAVAASSNGIMVNNERFGRWLRKVDGKIVNGLKLMRGGAKDGYPLWGLVEV